jgi:hypothetical protein
MKKILVFALVVLCSSAAIAQQDLKKKIVDSTCACLSEMPGLKEKSTEEIQVAVGQCMMQKSMTDFMALAQERNIDFSDQDAMQKLGAEIGMDLVKADCKAMNSLMVQIAQSKLDDKPGEAKETNMVKGLVQNVTPGEFVYVTVLSGAKSTQLTWSDYVTGGDNYVKNFALLKNRTLQFTYTAKEVYSPKAKAYINVKMIIAVK